MKITRACSIDGCDQVHVARGLCGRHYIQGRRSGTLYGLHAPGCIVAGCDRRSYCKSYCDKHYQKVRACGNAVHPSRRGSPPGARSYGWKGTEIGYAAAHSRVYKVRGRASDHSCLDCGLPARHWSYDHADPAERTDPTYQYPNAPYSVDPAHYKPRCASCHKKYDYALAEEAMR